MDEFLDSPKPKLNPKEVKNWGKQGSSLQVFTSSPSPPNPIPISSPALEHNTCCGLPFLCPHLQGITQISKHPSPRSSHYSNPSSCRWSMRIWQIEPGEQAACRSSPLLLSSTCSSPVSPQTYGWAPALALPPSPLDHTDLQPSSPATNSSRYSLETLQPSLPELQASRPLKQVGEC